MGVNGAGMRTLGDARDAGGRVPTLNAYLTVIVRDSTGKVIKVHRQRSHSPTANFMGLFLPLTYFSANNASFTITSTAGASSSYKPGLGSSYQNIAYPSSQNNYYTYVVMIQVGTGTQSNPYTATDLASPIANGSSGGQLVYQSVVPPSSVIVSGDSAYLYISQTYNNQSGGTITISEVGIITEIETVTYNNSGSTNLGQILVWYDTLSSSISVPNGGSVTIYFTFVVNP